MKWKNLKDNYNKYQKNTQTTSGQEYKKYKNWPWADLMRFLDDFKFRRTTETNTPSQIEEINRSAVQSSMIDDLNSTSCIEWDVHDSPESNTAGEKKRRKTKNIEEPADKILDYLKNKNQQKQHKKMDEADHLFQSYAESFKKFSPKMQAMLKLDMATLFARYELRAVGETSVMIPILTQPFPSTSRLGSASSHLSMEQERPQSILSNFSTSTTLPESISPHEFQYSQPSEASSRHYEDLVQHTLSDDVMSPTPNYHNM